MPISVSSGIFWVVLNPVFNNPAAGDLRTQNLWLETWVGSAGGSGTTPPSSYGILTPREQLTSNWYSLHALSAEGISASTGPVSFVIGASTHIVIDSNGNLIMGQSNPNATIFVSTGGIAFPNGTRMNTAGVGSADALYSSGTITIAVQPTQANSGNGNGIIMQSQAGAGSGTTNGGNINVTAGNSGNGQGIGGGINIAAGNAAAISTIGSNGGPVTISAGYGYTGGSVTICSGYGYTGQPAGSIAMIVGTASTPALTVSAGSNVGIGTTSPGEKLDIENSTIHNGLKIGNSSGNYMELFDDGNAHIEGTAGTTLWINQDNAAATNIGGGGGGTTISGNASITGNASVTGSVSAGTGGISTTGSATAAQFYGLMFGARTSETSSAAAPSDGYVSASVTANNDNGNAAEIQVTVAETVRGCASCYWSTPAGSQVQCPMNSCLVPVRKGESWSAATTIIQQNAAGGITSTVYWIPLGSAN